MLDFKAKMHQIQFWLGLRPRLRWRSLQRSPEPLAGFNGPTSEGREGRAENGTGKGEKRKGKRKRGEGKGDREEKGRGAYGDEGPLTKILNMPLFGSHWRCSLDRCGRLNWLLVRTIITTLTYLNHG